jgi:hypothetical protein
MQFSIYFGPFNYLFPFVDLFKAYLRLYPICPIGKLYHNSVLLRSKTLDTITWVIEADCHLNFYVNEISCELTAHGPISFPKFGK